MSAELDALEHQYFELIEEVYQAISKVADPATLNAWREVRSKSGLGTWGKVPLADKLDYVKKLSQSLWSRAGLADEIAEQAVITKQLEMKFLGVNNRYRKALEALHEQEKRGRSEPQAEEGLSPEEKRKYPRIPTNLIAHLRRSTEKAGEPAGGAAVGNVSRGGAFIETTREFKTDDVIEFDMYLPRKKQKVSILGVVRWVDSSPSRGIGVEFIRAITSDRSQLERFIDDQAPEG